MIKIYDIDLRGVFTQFRHILKVLTKLSEFLGGWSDGMVVKSTCHFFPGDPSWIPSAYIRLLTTSVTPALENLTLSSALLGTCMWHTLICVLID